MARYFSIVSCYPSEAYCDAAISSHAEMFSIYPGRKNKFCSDKSNNHAISRVHSHHVGKTPAYTIKRQHPARLDQVQSLATMCPATSLPGISRKQVVYIGIAEFFFSSTRTCTTQQKSSNERAVGQISRNLRCALRLLNVMMP